jgi:hypothetical protein
MPLMILLSRFWATKKKQLMILNMPLYLSQPTKGLLQLLKIVESNTQEELKDLQGF